MPANHRIVSIQDFLRTNLSGTYDFEDTKVAFQEIIASCNAAAVHRILLDIRNVQETDIESADIFSLVMHLLSLDIVFDFRMAIVNEPKDEIDRAKLFEHCAQHHGVDVAAFRDFEKALSWLNQGQL
jgi:hypothetical protein